MNTESLSQELAQLIENKISSCKKSISLTKTRNNALELAIKTNGKGRAISREKIEQAIYSVDQRDFNDIKSELSDEEIQRAILKDISFVPSGMLKKASKNKRLLKKFVGMIVRGTIIRLLSQELFRRGAGILGGLGLASGGAQAIAIPSAENFYITLNPYEYFTENQIEIFEDFLSTDGILIDDSVDDNMIDDSMIDVNSIDADVDIDDIDLDISDIDVDTGIDVGIDTVADAGGGLLDFILEALFG